MTLRLAIVGRPNVGKSTLFNRLAHKKMAIVDNTPGVTRDWRETDGWLFDEQIKIIDTAGLEESFDDSIQGRMRQQTEEALAHADVVLFLVDGRSGVTPLDEHFADWLRRLDKPVILGVNKCENDRSAAAGVAEAWGLGLGEPIPFSASHGFGVEDIYYALKPYLPEKEEEKEDADDTMPVGWSEGTELDAIEGDENFDFIKGKEEKLAELEEKPIKIAIVGRPNVGKSTLMNAILGEKRVMTGPEAGITRDAIAAYWQHNGKKMRLVDTAGLRRKAKIVNKIEKMSADDSLRAIRLAQVVVLVIDANAILDRQDLAIAHHVLKEGRALILAVNKWDDVKDRDKAIEQVEYKIRTSMGSNRDTKWLSISALKGKRLDKLLDTVLEVYQMWHSRVKTGQMNKWIMGMESHHPPPLVNGRPNKLRYIAQIKTRPPTFALWCGRPDDLPETYKRYLINGIREKFGVSGVPIRMIAKTSKNPYT